MYNFIVIFGEGSLLKSTRFQKIPVGIGMVAFAIVLQRACSCTLLKHQWCCGKNCPSIYTFKGVTNGSPSHNYGTSSQDTPKEGPGSIKRIQVVVPKPTAINQHSQFPRLPFKDHGRHVQWTDLLQKSCHRRTVTHRWTPTLTPPSHCLPRPPWPPRLWKRSATHPRRAATRPTPGRPSFWGG